MVRGPDLMVVREPMNVCSIYSIGILVGYDVACGPMFKAVGEPHSIWYMAPT